MRRITMRIALFATCLSELFYQDALKDMVEVLERLGCDLDFPDGQTCCGQPTFNSGYRNETKKAARQMITSFEMADYVVTPSGSCAGMLKEYPGLFWDDVLWRERAQQLADKTYEFTQ